jgi:3-oxoacyl-[acyl-carrier protein] reductase
MSGDAALITGAAGGLGRAIALHLAVPGRTLLLHHRSDPARAEETAGAVQRHGATAILLQADLARADERERLMDQVQARTPTLRILINNAGTYLDEELQDVTPRQWQEVFDSTCSAVFHVTQRALPLLRAGAPARVVNIGDSGADRVVARLRATPYHIAKLGVHVLTRSYAKLLAPDGITVNQISPGFLENSVGAPGTPVPAGRLGAFTDILSGLDFLLSPAAEYTTGANLLVSGGWNL